MRNETRACLGVAVVGSGRIGTLRAEMASRHPAVGFIGVSDQDPDRAEALRTRVGGNFATRSNDELISREEVAAVIVSTPEADHVAPVLKALELGKPVLVEKPIALSLKDADRILEAMARTGGDLHVGYSRRFKECFLRSKEQLNHGRLGEIVGGMARVYNSRAQAFAILKRDPDATPVVDVLTYYVDLMCWFTEGNPPVEVIARGTKGVFADAGFGADDVTWVIVTLRDGATFSLGVSYALPARYPTLGQSDRVEILGREGTMIVDDDHLDHMIFSDIGVPHAYVPDHAVNMAFLGSNTAGDWAVGDFWGPLANETRAWLDGLTTGRRSPVHTSAEQARTNLAVTLAIEESARTGGAVAIAT